MDNNGLNVTSPSGEVFELNDELDTTDGLDTIEEISEESFEGHRSQTINSTSTDHDHMEPLEQMNITMVRENAPLEEYTAEDAMSPRQLGFIDYYLVAIRNLVTNSSDILTHGHLPMNTEPKATVDGYSDTPLFSTIRRRSASDGGFEDVDEDQRSNSKVSPANDGQETARVPPLLNPMVVALDEINSLLTSIKNLVSNSTKFLNRGTITSTVEPTTTDQIITVANSSITTSPVESQPQTDRHHHVQNNGWIEIID